MIGQTAGCGASRQFDNTHSSNPGGCYFGYAVIILSTGSAPGACRHRCAGVQNVKR